MRLALVHDGVLTRQAQRLLWLIAMCCALAGPGAASAHSRAPTTALDYRLRVAPMPAPLAGVRAEVLDGDRELRLTVPRSVTLIVPGLVGEPFLRFGSDGVWVHRLSPTAAADKLVTPHEQGDGWIRLTRANELAWHDHRLAPPPNIPVGSSAPFALAVRVNGAPAVIRGSFMHVSRPRLWPWLLGAAVGRRRSRRGRTGRSEAAWHSCSNGRSGRRRGRPGEQRWVCDRHLDDAARRLGRGRVSRCPCPWRGGRSVDAGAVCPDVVGDLDRADRSDNQPQLARDLLARRRDLVASHDPRASVSRGRRYRRPCRLRDRRPRGRGR